MRTPFLVSEVKTLMLQLLSAISLCHDNWIIHRDLKTSNLLMNNRGQIKLADFGLARTYGEPLGDMTQLVVTLWYRCANSFYPIKLELLAMSADADVFCLTCYPLRLIILPPLWLPRAPELLLGETEYSTAVDMWSIGCIMAEMIQKEPLMPGKGEIDQINLVSSKVQRLGRMGLSIVI